MVVTEDPQAHTPESHVIEVQDLEFSYGGTKALDKLSFSLGQGEILGLIGKNGAGKTTTIHLLLGLLRYKKGRIHVLGMDPKHDSINILDGCGFFPEQGEPYEWMRVAHLYNMGQYSYSSWDHALCRQLSEQLELDTHKRIGDLSKGMLVKAKLIFALAHRPQILLLDEPTNGLDPLSRYDMLSIIKSLSTQHEVTVLISSHNLDEVADMATQICIIDKGKDILSASMEAIQTKFALLECAAAALIPDPVSSQVVKSKTNGDRAQHLVMDKMNPSVINFIQQCGSENAALKEITLKELFVFITRNAG